MRFRYACVKPVVKMSFDEVHVISRRDFLKAGSMGVAATALPLPGSQPRTEPFPDTDYLCRVSEDTVRVHSRPHPDSPTVSYLRQDQVIPYYCQLVGEGYYSHNHVWYETDQGFVWSSYAQPVKNLANPILESISSEGIWTEVTVPFVDSRSRADLYAPVVYRLYYGMVLNVDQRVEGSDGEIWYRVHDENNIMMYAHGSSFRHIPPDELAPISPEVENKEIRINLLRQDLSAFENGVEVYYCRIASGYAYYKDDMRHWHTPVGDWYIWRKMVSRHMGGGDAVTGYDLAGVGWTILFTATGEAIHSTYWHNDYGAPRSNGCVNVLPDDGKWLFRWTTPDIGYHPGDLTVSWPNRGTLVVVRE
jgi:hypothetical protein